MALAENEYLKNGVLYRNDLKVGDDGMNWQERSNKKMYSPDAAVGADGLTSKQRAREVLKAKKEKRAYPLELLKKEFKLETNKGGTAWTHQAVAAFMARDMDFIVTSVYKNAATPLEGFCLRCGESTPEGKGTLWSDITQGISACNSSACGGNRMPTEKFMESVFTERGVELVGTYPTSATRKFWLRHIGGEGACQQKYEATWGNFYNLKQGCAVCRGLQIVVGFNDLASIHPELASEMLFPDPTTVTAFSSIKADWRCGECNYEWQVMIGHRSSGSGCPKCIPRGYNLTTPNGTIYFSNHATESARPRRRIGKVGITKEFLRRRTEHARTNLNFREGSISMLMHPDPHIAKVLEDMVHDVMKNANMKVTDIKLKERETEFTPRELFRVRDVRCNGEIVGDIYDLLEWVQVQSDEDFARALDIGDEWLCTNCDGVVQYPLDSLIYTEL